MTDDSATTNDLTRLTGPDAWLLAALGLLLCIAFFWLAALFYAGSSQPSYISGSFDQSSGSFERSGRDRVLSFTSPANGVVAGAGVLAIMIIGNRLRREDEGHDERSPNRGLAEQALLVAVYLLGAVSVAGALRILIWLSTIGDSVGDAFGGMATDAGAVAIAVTGAVWGKRVHEQHAGAAG